MTNDEYMNCAHLTDIECSKDKCDCIKVSRGRGLTNKPLSPRRIKDLKKVLSELTTKPTT